MKRATFRLRVLSSVDTKEVAVLTPTEGTTPAILGNFDGPDYVCGTCSLLLISGLNPTNHVDLVIRCWSCGSLNHALIPTPGDA
jgi:hypothetical protein